MAIYHLEAKVVSRGAGRSAVAASAYLSCSRLYNDYDGIQHDYTKKQGLVWQEVFLPAMAPPEWKDREQLWNAVEEVETAKGSRLAREFVVALPIELSRTEQIELLQEFIREQFVSDGMCADAAIHDTDGHNPHAHILLTVRPLDEQGKWQYKTEKEYLCMKNGEERGFTAAEFRAAQNEGWEKQYPYKVGKKKVYMTPSAAKAQELNVFSVTPRSKVKLVAKMLKAIHAQESKKAAREKAKAVVEELRSMKLKEAAKKVEDSIEETLTYCDFPSEHWTRIRTNNVIERLNREIRRRTRVVGSFPDGNSALMLVCARLRHVAGTQWGNKKYMNMKHLEAALEDASIAG